jgi:hypothetical protein
MVFTFLPLCMLPPHPRTPHQPLPYYKEASLFCKAYIKWLSSPRPLHLGGLFLLKAHSLLLAQLVSHGCHNKLPATRWLKITNLLSHSSGGQKSKIRITGPHFLSRLQEMVHCFLLPALGAISIPWLVAASLQSAYEVTLSSHLWPMLTIPLLLCYIALPT